MANGSLEGTLDFSPVGQAQRIDVHLTADRADSPGAFAVRSGRADGTIVLADERTTVDGTVDARGIGGGALSLARLTANARLVNGTGQVRAAFAGRRGAAFSFSTLADIADSIRLTGSGQIERRSLELEQAAVLTRDGDGWALAQTSCALPADRQPFPGAAAHVPRFTLWSAPCRWKCSTSAGPPQPQRVGDRPPRL